MPLRSLLFVPGDDDRKLAGAARHGADALILDLEDSVAPARKTAAREKVAACLQDSARTSGPACMVRINAIQSGLAWDDLAAVLPARPAAIVLPKGDPALLAQLDHYLSEHEPDSAQATPLYVLATETAVGVFAAGGFAGVSARLRGLSWGHEDLAAELGATNRRADGLYAPAFELARSLCLLGAAVAGVDAIDGAFMDFSNLAAFTSECEMARRDGFVAKLAIHPAQVPIINQTFTPSAEQVSWARRVVAAFLDRPELGVTALDGKVVDLPHLRLAQRLLARL